MSAEHRHYPERFEEPRDEPLQPLHSPSRTEFPTEGQEFFDGFSPGYSWVVGEIAQETVTLLLLHHDEPTSAVIQWPLNRWPALIDKLALTLKGAARCVSSGSSTATARAWSTC